MKPDHVDTKAPARDGGAPPAADLRNGGVAPGQEQETTDLLIRWAGGSAEAGDALMERLYPDLRRLAARHRSDLDLSEQISDIAQDLFLRLADQRRVQWQSRAHFFAIAARLARRVVVDHVREKQRQRRGGNTQHVELDDDLVAMPGSPIQAAPAELLALDQALDELSQASPLAVRIVELRFFAGLSIEQTAEVLEVGRATAVRQWRFARAWLRSRLTDGGAERSRAGSSP